MTISQSDTLYNYIKDAIVNMAPKIVLTEEFLDQEIRQAIRNVMRDNPQYFWYAYRYDFTPDTRTITIHYSFSREKVDFFTQQIDTVVEKDFRLEFVRTLSPLNQICYIYNWLIWYTNYNTESAFNQTIVSVFVKRNSVCTGYAKAAQYLCQLLGIESKLVFGRFYNDKEEGRHCWNIVKLDSKWYHIDVCLGDPCVAKNILPNSSIESAQDSHILYDNFCVSTEKILETRSIEDIDKLPTCSNCIESIPDVKLQSTSRLSNLGCQVSTVGMTSKVYLATNDKHKVIKTVEGKDWKKLVENERNCYNALSECPYILRYYGGCNNKIILEQATPLTDLMQSHYYKPTTNSVLNLLIDIATAVKYCFDKGFAYRDVHIGNIYRRCNRTWVLGDFGHCVPITADNTYSDVVGHPRFIPQFAITNGLFDRSSATYSLIKILEFIMDEYKLSLSNISERIAFGLKEHKSEDPLEILINILTKGSEGDSFVLCDSLNDCDIQDEITISNDIESFANTSAIPVFDDCDDPSLELFATSKALNHNGYYSDNDTLATTEHYVKCSHIPTVKRTSKFRRNTNSDSAIKNSPNEAKTDDTLCGNILYGLHGAVCGSFLGPFGAMLGAFLEKTYKEKKDSSHSNKELDTISKPDIVNSCVYAPAEVIHDDYMLVQVYLYRDEESDKVRAKATAIDKSAEIRQYMPLELPIKIGDEVRIHLKMKGTEIEADTKLFRWTGSFKGCEFSVYVPKDFSHSTLLGTVDVFINNMPAGEMIFKTAVVDTVQSNLLANIEARAFEKIFVSYSHKDTPIVRPLVEGLRIANKDYFFDRHSLKGGDKYREEIRKWIESSDVFVLCWSKNAAESVEVASEKNYALEVISRNGSRLRLYPVSISPEAPLPSDMNDTYNFAQLNP